MLTVIRINRLFNTSIDFSKFDNLTVKVNFWHLFFTKNLKVIRVFYENFAIFLDCLLTDKVCYGFYRTCRIRGKHAMLGVELDVITFLCLARPEFHAGFTKLGIGANWAVVVLFG